MLQAGFAAIGIGRAFDASSAFGWYWTADFGGAAEGPTPTPTSTPMPTLTPTPTTTPSADTDGDHCADNRETGPDPAKGGTRDPQDPWDFYDVLGFNFGPPDSVVDLANDILGVIQHYSPTGYTPDTPAIVGSGVYDDFDRGPADPQGQLAHRARWRHRPLERHLGRHPATRAQLQLGRKISRPRGGT